MHSCKPPPLTFRAPRLRRLGASNVMAEKFDGEVVEGMCPLQPAALSKLDPATRQKSIPLAPDGNPTLVLIHGTFSDTSGFRKLWTEHPQSVQEIFKRYG